MDEGTIDTFRTVIAFGLTLLLVLLRLEAQRFGAAEYDEPIGGRLPRKAEGDYLRHLRLIAHEVNTPRLVVHAARLGEHRWLIGRLPHRFEVP